MHVVHHAHLAHRRSGGEAVLVAAGCDQGIAGFEIWLMTLEPGSATREFRHGGELVAVAQEGSGKLLIDGGPQRFHAPCSLLIPQGCVFQVGNNGASPLKLVWVCTERPQALPDENADPIFAETAP